MVIHPDRVGAVGAGRAQALASARVQEYLGGREPKKVIIVPDRMVNIVG